MFTYFLLFRLLNRYEKLYTLFSVLAFFSFQTWIFRDNNTASLTQKLSKNDKSLFKFDVVKIDWSTYFKIYMIGIRTYIIKDPIDTLDKGVKHRKK